MITLVTSIVQFCFICVEILDVPFQSMSIFFKFSTVHAKYTIDPMLVFFVTALFVQTFKSFWTSVNQTWNWQKIRNIVFFIHVLNQIIGFLGVKFAQFTCKEWEFHSNGSIWPSEIKKSILEQSLRIFVKSVFMNQDNFEAEKQAFCEIWKL